MTISNAAKALFVAGVAAVVAVEPAFAGVLPEPVPAPLLGAGAPALAAFAAGYWAIRKRRRG